MLPSIIFMCKTYSFQIWILMEPNIKSSEIIQTKCSNNLHIVKRPQKE
jgi:hypothetical protein